jgi:hypothetical protein
VDCNSADDFRFVLHKGVTSIDEPNTIYIYSPVGKQICVDQSSAVKIYYEGDTICNQNATWSSQATFQLACFGTIGCVGPDTAINAYFGYRNSNNQEGWIRFSFNLNDAGSATTPVIFAVDTVLMTCLTNDISSNLLAPSIQVFPNPAREFVTIKSSQNIRTLQITNTRGQVVSNVPVNTNTATLRLQEFAPDIYIMRIELNEEVIYRKLTVN